MNFSNNIFKKSNLLPFFIGLFVITLQIQWTLTISSWQIRLSLSDIVWPFLLFFFISTRENLNQVHWRFSWLSLWMFIFSSWVGISLLKGYFETGVLSKWALFNKFLGWFILMGYFFLGNYLSSFNNQKSLEKPFLKALFLSSACISLFSLIIVMLFNNYGLLLSFLPRDSVVRFTGFLENANAYGLFGVFAILLQIPFTSSIKLFPSLIQRLIFFFNILSVVGSGSRGASVALCVGLGVCLYLKLCRFRDLCFIIMCVILSLFLVMNLKTTSTYLFAKKEDVTKMLSSIGKSESDIRFDHTASVRILITKQAIKWWKENPVMGIGLGQFLVKQQQDMSQDAHANTPPVTIHNTVLWLLTETGIIGVLLFFVFTLKILQVMSRKACSLEEDASVAKSNIAIILSFFVASLFMEVVYQRYLWVFLGLILSDTAKGKRNASFVSKFFNNKYVKFNTPLQH